MARLDGKQKALGRELRAIWEGQAKKHRKEAQGECPSPGPREHAAGIVLTVTGIALCYMMLLRPSSGLTLRGSQRC